MNDCIFKEGFFGSVSWTESEVQQRTPKPTFGLIIARRLYSRSVWKATEALTVRQKANSTRQQRVVVAATRRDEAETVRPSLTRLDGPFLIGDSTGSGRMDRRLQASQNAIWLCVNGDILWMYRPTSSAWDSKLLLV